MISLNPFSSSLRPCIAGRRGAISAAHPLAVAAGQQMFFSGGNAADAQIAAQAVLSAVAPEACGLGGDSFAVLKSRDELVAINGAGRAPADAESVSDDGAQSVTVPGMVDGWDRLATRGRLGLRACLQPAIECADQGVRVDPGLIAARNVQAKRLREGGADDWALMSLSEGGKWKQPELAKALTLIAENGSSAYYSGSIAAVIQDVLATRGSAMSLRDLAAGAAAESEPLTVTFEGHDVHMQPPASQGVLLSMCLKAWAEGGYSASNPSADHIAVELTQAAFAFRDQVSRGANLLTESLEIDLGKASLRGGPRSYLHTAGVATADADGMVVSSLVSVFDDFGSGVFVPEYGFVLNNRGGGFSSGLNRFEPGKRPIHTLAPALVEGPLGCIALSTPGADGQVQTLLQILLGWLGRGDDIAQVVAQSRWRSEDGKLLVETGHHARDDLADRGHLVVDTHGGDMRFGAVTLAGQSDNSPFALADWRRNTWAAVS